MALFSINIKKLIVVCDEPCDNEPQEPGYFSSLSIFDGKQSLLTLKGKLNIMALSMTDTQQASGTLAFVDKHGHATDVPDGNVTVTSSDEAVATASYDDASNTVTVKAVAPGVAALTVAAKNAAGADLPFEDVAIEIKSGDAVGGTITFGEPTENPDA
jgi:hypothetical protein